MTDGAAPSRSSLARTCAVAAALGAAVLLPLPLVLPGFAACGADWAMLLGAGALLAVAFAIAGLLIARFAGRSLAAGAALAARVELALLAAIVGALLAGLPGAVTALAPFAIMALADAIRGRPWRDSGPGWIPPLVAVPLIIALGLLDRPAVAPAPERQLVLVGLDGADWRIIDALREQGRLPTFDALIENGARGELDTLRPTLSPLIWTSIATGKRPRDHGVADFYTSAQEVRAKRLWDIAHEHGLIAGVQSYLVTWPPSRQVSFMVPGWLSQSDETHPADLRFVKTLDRWLSARQDVPSTPDVVSLLPAALQHGVSLQTLRKMVRTGS